MSDYGASRIWKFDLLTELDEYRLIPISERPHWLQNETDAMEVYTNLCSIAGTCAGKSYLGPMPGAVRPHLFHDRRDERGVTLFLSGTEFQKGTGFQTDIMALRNQPNVYFDSVKHLMLSRPDLFQHKSILIVGHSLGGMVGEQLAMDKDIQRKVSNRIRLLNFGSPMISGFDPKRLGLEKWDYLAFDATGDFVPHVAEGLPKSARQDLDQSTALHLTYPFLYRWENFPWLDGLPACIRYSHPEAFGF